MNIPLPKNKLVALTLAGGLITVLVAVGLSVPNWFRDSEKSTVSSTLEEVRTAQEPTHRPRTYSTAKNSESGVTNPPRPRENVQPAVHRRRSLDEEEEEDGEYKEGEHEREHEPRGYVDPDHEE